MPGMRCAVAVCNNSWEKVKRRDASISFHRFPKNYKRQKIWVNACGRSDKWNPNSSYVCSIHFSEDDFESNLRALLMPNTVAVKKLKKTAIPIYLLKKDDGRDQSTSEVMWKECCETRQDEKIKEELLVIDDIIITHKEIKEEEETLESKFYKISSENNDMKEAVLEVQQGIDSQTD